MNEEDILAWRTIVRILQETGYYNLYEEEISRISNILRGINETKH